MSVTWSPWASRGWASSGRRSSRREVGTSYLRKPSVSGYPMKLSFSAASPFARKVRIAAIELGLIDKIELTPATVAPGTANEDYSRITPLKKLPVLITNDGDVILDSYVIVEYLNEMAGGSLIPDHGPRRWKA